MTKSSPQFQCHNEEKGLTPRPHATIAHACTLPGRPRENETGVSGETEQREENEVSLVNR